MSGSSSGFFGVALEGAVAESTQTLARLVGCRRLNTSEDIVECLREVDPLELDFWALFGTIVVRQQLPNFMPVIDGEFVAQHPSESWAQGVAGKYDCMTGYTHHDAAGYITVNPSGEYILIYCCLNSLMLCGNVLNIT